MSLPSQHMRMGGRVVTTRRRRRSPRQTRQRIAVVAIFGVLALITWWVWPSGGSDGPAEGPIASADGSDDGEPLNFLANGHASGSGGAEGGERAGEVPGTSRPERTPRTEPERRSTMPPLVISQAPTGDGPGLVNDPAPIQPASSSQPASLATPERAQAGTPARTSGSQSANLERVLSEASAFENEGRLVQARDALNRAMFSGWATEADRAELRVRMSRLHGTLLFSPDVYAGDPMTGSYEVKGGDSLSRIVTRENLAVDWRLLQRVNALARPESIRVGQTLKVVNGPFHAVVDKSDYRLDLYWGDPERPAEWIFVRSYRVGLGEDDSTPVGRFAVKRNSRLVDPAWTNPRTGEKHAPGEGNPIGRYWIGLEGEGDSASLTGYGIHGTNEPGSIGQQLSMGCVRLGDDDIAEVFTLLVEEDSRVRIVP